MKMHRSRLRGRWTARVVVMAALAAYAVVVMGGCAEVEATPITPSSNGETRTVDVVDRRASIGQPCEALRERMTGGAPIAVFVEVAHVLSPLDGAFRTRLRQPVDVDEVAGALVEKDKASGGPFRSCIAPPCAAPDGTLELRMSSLPTSVSAPLDLDLRFDRAMPVNVDGGSGRSGRDAEKPDAASDDPYAARRVLRMKNQEPMLLEPSVGTSGAVVVTAYYLAEPKEESLRLLAQCRAHRSAAR